MCQTQFIQFFQGTSYRKLCVCNYPCLLDCSKALLKALSPSSIGPGELWKNEGARCETKWHAREAMLWKQFVKLCRKKRSLLLTKKIVLLCPLNNKEFIPGSLFLTKMAIRTELTCLKTTREPLPSFYFWCRIDWNNVKIHQDLLRIVKTQDLSLSKEDRFHCALMTWMSLKRTKRNAENGNTSAPKRGPSEGLASAKSGIRRPGKRNLEKKSKREYSFYSWERRFF